MPKRTKLSPKQIKALALLAAGQGPEAVAAEVGVDSGLINVWMKTDLFADELRLAAERVRARFESRVFQLANASANVVGQMIGDENDKNRQLEGVKLAFGAAVRLANRYKELQVEGYIAPVQPLVVFPAGTKFPWQNKTVLPPVPLEIPSDVIDVEAEAKTDDEGADTI